MIDSSTSPEELKKYILTNLNKDDKAIILNHLAGKGKKPLTRMTLYYRLSRFGTELHKDTVGVCLAYIKAKKETAQLKAQKLDGLVKELLT